MALMFKYNSCLDQTLNNSHGQQNRNPFQQTLLLIHSLIMMMEVFIIRKKFQSIFLQILMIF